MARAPTGQGARLPGARALSDPGPVAAFLAHQPPFDGLDADELTRVVATTRTQSFAAVAAILVEDGPPAPGVWVVESGGVELLHGDHVVDVLEPGECFGHPSLLSGMAPVFTVRAREASTCLFVGREAAIEVFAHPAGARYIALSLRERLVRSGQTAHALPELSMTRLGALVSRAPLFVAPDATVRDAAVAMTAEQVGAALVQMPAGPSVVTDRDLREQVLARGGSADDPVTVAIRPALCAPTDRTASEALVDLLDAHVRELCVTDARGAVIGLLSVEDIVGGEHSPFELRRAILRAHDEDELVAIVSAGLPRLLASLLSAGLAPADVTRALAVQSDSATLRLLELGSVAHGQAPVAWAWLALGSVARRELTLASDQDNALAYADGAGAEDAAWFARLAGGVNAGLARCGLGEDSSEVLARNPAWRMSAARWAQVFAQCLEHPDRSHLVRAAVAFDFRPVAGGLEVVPALAAVVRDARTHPGFLARPARTATDWPVPLGRRGSFHRGDDGRIDLKAGGALPIANIARLHAFTAGITISGTLDRLLAAQEVGQLDVETATALREAFETVTRVRLEHHAACLRDGRPADNRIDPGELPPLRRAALREALRAVAGAQRRLGVFRPLSM